MAAPRLLQMELPNLGSSYRHASVGTHLDTGQLVIDETAMDVLRDIFPSTGTCVIYERVTATPSFGSSYKEPLNSSLYLEDANLPALDYFTSLSFLVESCARTRRLEQGMSLHHHIVCFGLEGNASLCDNLVWMYGRCGIGNDAFYCFDNMGDRSSTMWSFMIGLHVQFGGKRGSAVDLFWQSLNCSVFPDMSTLLLLLSWCRGNQHLVRGKQLHVLIKGLGWERDVVAGTALLSMYGRCNSFEEARMSFYKILDKNVVTWSAMISACVQHDKYIEAVWLFTQMHQEGLLPNKVTIISALSACTKENNILMGKFLHIQVPNEMIEHHVDVAAALVNMYGKCGSIKNACMIFQDVSEPCVVLWTGMLTAYCLHGYTKESSQAFSRMLEHGIFPNEVTYLTMVSSFESTEDLYTGKRIHAQILSSGIMSNFVISTAIMLMYGKCGSMVDAHQIHGFSAEKCVIAWGAMISLCVNKGQSYEGIQLFDHMQLQGLNPDKFTYVNVLRACACVSALFEGKKVHHFVLQSDFTTDIFVCNALVDMYSKCNLLGAAQLVFDEMHERDMVSWNSLIVGYTQSGYGKEALILFHQMQIEKVVPDHVTFSSILTALSERADLCECWGIHSSIIRRGFDMELIVVSKLIYVYNKSGSLEGAQSLINRRHERDEALWSAFVTSHNQLDMSEAFQLFDQIRSEGVLPGIATLSRGLSVCLSNGALTKVEQLHISILHSDGGSSSESMHFLVHAYSECGDLAMANHLFHLFCNHDSKLWNYMIAGLARHGNGIGAIELLKEMQQWGAAPNELTFVHLLHACSHCGLVDEAIMLMNTLWGVQVAAIHYDCIIDMLGRVGQMNQAVVMMEVMPFKPTAVTLTSVLSTCSVTLNLSGGKCAMDHLIEVREENFAPYLLLSVLDARLDQGYGE